MRVYGVGLRVAAVGAVMAAVLTAAPFASATAPQNTGTFRHSATVQPITKAASTDRTPRLHVAPLQRQGYVGGAGGPGVAAPAVAGGAGPALVAPLASVAPVTVSVSLGGTGAGHVVSNPIGIDCPSVSCQSQWSPGTPLTLTATPATGSAFIGWGGACTGTAACTFTLTANVGIIATFQPMAALTSATIVGTTPGLQASGGFAGASDASPLCPTRPCFEPPDPWVAVGPSHIVQATNDGIRISDRSGSLLRDYYLWDFFAEATLSTSATVLDGDPHVLWDGLHGRWLASEMALTCTTGYLILAVSRTADPTGVWDTFTASTPNAFPDYPGLGFSIDKIGLSYNQFGLLGCSSQGVPNFSAFQGGVIGEIDYAPVLSFASNPSTVILSHFVAPQMNHFTFRPAPGASDSVLHYVVGVSGSGPGSTPADVVVGTITGVASGTPVFTEQNLTTAASSPLPAFAAPPAPNQPGSPPTIAAATDGRPTDAIYWGGTLYFVATTACYFTNSSEVEPCVRVTSVGTKNQDFAIAISGQATFMGGIGVSGDGTLFVVYSDSSPTRTVATYATYQAAGDAAGTIHVPALIRKGEATYLGSRWGDFVGVAFDPSDAGAVWQADEYPDQGGGWSTWVSKLALASGAPAGTAAFGGGATSTSSLSVTLTLTPAAGAQVTQALVSNSANTSLGLLALAAQLPAGGTVTWRLDDAATGGNGSPGAKSVCVQWGDGAGGWSTPGCVSITFTAPAKVIREAGPDRFATAAAVSAATFAPGVRIAYVAYAFNFPDALAGAAAAGTYPGPVLLTDTNTLNSATTAELLRLKPRQIAILGSTGVISDAVKTALAPYATSGEVLRLWGSDRFATAAAISQTIFAPGVPVAYIAYAFNFPDALAGAAAAGTVKGPVLLAATTGPLATATANELTRLKPQRIVVLGSSGVISDSVMAALGAYTTGGVTRAAGPDRFATAAAVSAQTFSPGVDVVYVAYAFNFPDALAGAAAAGTRRGPVLLVDTTGAINAATATELTRLKPHQIVVLGSAGVISDGVMSALAAYVP